MLTDGIFDINLPQPSTSGNVLTSDGDNWVSQAAAPNVGAWKFLSEIVSTDSTTIDFSNVFDSTYDNYRITANNVGSNTTNVNLSASVERSTNIGTYHAYQYYIRLHPQSTSTWTYGGGGVFAQNVNNTGSEAQRSNFVADIFNPVSTNSKGVNFYGNGLCGFGTISFQYILSALQYNSPTTPQSGIRFQASSGTITGTYRLYGFSKT